MHRETIFHVKSGSHSVYSRFFFVCDGRFVFFLVSFDIICGMVDEESRMKINMKEQGSGRHEFQWKQRKKRHQQATTQAQLQHKSKTRWYRHSNNQE